MTKHWMRVLALIAVAILAFAACSSDDDDDSGGSSDDTEETTTTTAADDGDDGDDGGPSITIEPNTVTVPADCTPDAPATCPVVKVSGAGFTPGLTLGVNECVDKGEDTGAGDCNLGGLKTGTVNPDGTVDPIDFPVVKGPFGENQVTCGVEGPCVLSLGELAEGDVERATTEITVE